MQYEVHLIDIETKKEFIKMIKNDYFLYKFKNKVKRSKKVAIIRVKNLYW